MLYNVMWQLYKNTKEDHNSKKLSFSQLIPCVCVCVWNWMMYSGGRRNLMESTRLFRPHGPLSRGNVCRSFSLVYTTQKMQGKERSGCKLSFDHLHSSLVHINTAHGNFYIQLKMPTTTLSLSLSRDPPARVVCDAGPLDTSQRALYAARDRRLRRRLLFLPIYYAHIHTHTAVIN